MVNIDELKKELQPIVMDIKKYSSDKIREIMSKRKHISGEILYMLSSRLADEFASLRDGCEKELEEEKNVTNRSKKDHKGSGVETRSTEEEKG